MMKSFRLLPASEGPRREFKITLGLRAGYGPAGRIYDLEEAVRAAHRWMTERAARGEPFLSGMFTRGEVVYADPGGGAASHREPVRRVRNKRGEAAELWLAGTKLLPEAALAREMEVRYGRTRRSRQAMASGA